MRFVRCNMRLSYQRLDARRRYSIVSRTVAYRRVIPSVVLDYDFLDRAVRVPADERNVSKTCRTIYEPDAHRSDRYKNYSSHIGHFARLLSNGRLLPCKATALVFEISKLVSRIYARAYAFNTSFSVIVDYLGSSSTNGRPKNNRRTAGRSRRRSERAINWTRSLFSLAHRRTKPAWSCAASSDARASRARFTLVVSRLASVSVSG